MLKLDFEKASKVMLADGIFGGICLVLAEIAAFHWLAQPWPFILALVWLAYVIGFIERAIELRIAVQERSQWRDTLALRSAMSAFHNDEREHYGDDSEFWDEMVRRANENLEYADARQAAKADLYGDQKPRAWLSFLSTVASQVIGLGFAWFVARLI